MGLRCPWTDVEGCGYLHCSHPVVAAQGIDLPPHGRQVADMKFLHTFQVTARHLMKGSIALCDIVRLYIRPSRHLASPATQSVHNEMTGDGVDEAVDGLRSNQLILQSPQEDILTNIFCSASIACSVGNIHQQAVVQLDICRRYNAVLVV